jgi:predicted ribosomally synthesized peptide with nif11-like leader
MSEEQLSAFLAKLKDDTGLQEKLQGAADFDAAVAIAKEAGFEVSKADWLKAQASQILEMSDEKLESVIGGTAYGNESSAGFLGVPLAEKIADNMDDNLGAICNCGLEGCDCVSC